MGSRGPKQRKKHTHLDKVPKYEEPNTMPLAGLSNQQGVTSGRAGHNADHHTTKQPGRLGTLFLRLLGKKPGDHI